MSIIYQPAGKAREYCALAANLYSGCSHACSYCYAPSALRRTAEKFQASAPRKDVIKKITKDAPKYAGQEVHLCFTCDPYQPIESEFRLTSQTLQLFNQHNIRARILTKGGSRCLEDIDLFKTNKSIVGATLTFIDPVTSSQWEPAAAPPEDRINALKHLHAAGVETWASLEPVIDPEQSLEIIRRCHPFVDTFKVGRWNYNRQANQIDWADFINRAVALLDQVGATYYIKDDLRIFLQAV